MNQETAPQGKEPPKKLGRYELVAKLGTGSMGVVYKAKDPTIGRFVALKTINFNLPLSEKEEADFRARFFREAQAAGSLVHPNIIQIYDIGEDVEAQASFIAMEFAPGANLRDFMANDQLLPVDKVCHIMKQLGRALDYAHSRSVIHRDIKPANLILTTSDELKIADFGIAKVPQSSLTQTGKLLGTPYYMAPEQIIGGDFDHRVDLFAAGVIFYQLLTGHLPFTGASMAAVAYKVVNEEPIAIAKYREDVPRALDKVVMKALTKKPQQRYARGNELADAVEAFEAAEREAAKKAAWVVSLHNARARLSGISPKRVGVAAAAIILLAAGIVAAVLWKPSAPPGTMEAWEEEAAPAADVPVAAETPAVSSPPVEAAPPDTGKTAAAMPPPSVKKVSRKETAAPPPPASEETAPSPSAPLTKPEAAVGLSHKLDSGVITVRDARGREMLRGEFTKEKVKGIRKVNPLRLIKHDYDWEEALPLAPGEHELTVFVTGKDEKGDFSASCSLRHAFPAGRRTEVAVTAKRKRNGEAALECEANTAKEKEKAKE